ncbi:MAG: helix-turn-helix transcriptional regulator [Anaerolineae bacterium]|nr:helix-turn-helix transcriptional regulator [Anaerolineae bacterium]
MSIIFEERASDSPYVEAVTRGYTASAGTSIRPAENHWYMVFTRVQGRVEPRIVGPWSTSGVVSWGCGAEVLWIRFAAGTFMPHLPTPRFRDGETLLPGATSQCFWLRSETWQFPDYDNVETFVDWLVRDDVLVSDPLVSAVLAGRMPRSLAPRTVRHRFLQATGLTQSHMHQVARAQQAQALLAQGTSILDTVVALDYFDQPHLTRSLKRYVGYTPAQIIRMNQPDCQTVQDAVAVLD